MNNDEALLQFTRSQKRLRGIAYRMLGSLAEAEDVVQDAYLRWHDNASADVKSAEAWLVTVTTRLCVDRLRSRKALQQTYVGPWLPEPVPDIDAVTPESKLELIHDLSMAFLVMLEQLSPEERAAFLLKEVFEYEYAEIAEFMGKSPTACRQYVHRAKGRLHDNQKRFKIDRQQHLALLEKFMAAARTGNREAVLALLEADASLIADGGGKANSTLHPLHGAIRLSWLYYALARHAGLDWRLALVNGEPGIVRFRAGELHSTMSFLTDGERIQAIYTVMNPDKLKQFKDRNPAVTF